MYAPIDGRIGEAKVKVGNLVGPDPAGGGAFTDLATIQQLDPMGVDIRLSSRDLDRTTAADRGGAGRPPDPPRPRRATQEHPYEGRCYFIDNTIDETTSTFLVKARIPNPGGTLLPGEYVKVRMVVDRLEDAVVVPAPAVMETEAGPVVYVVDEQGKVAVQRVEAGQTYEGLRVITKGLDAGRAGDRRGAADDPPGHRRSRPSRRSLDPRAIADGTEGHGERDPEARRAVRPGARRRGPPSSSRADAPDPSTHSESRSDPLREPDAPWSTSSSAGRSSPPSRPS